MKKIKIEMLIDEGRVVDCLQELASFLEDEQDFNTVIKSKGVTGDHFTADVSNFYRDDETDELNKIEILFQNNYKAAKIARRSWGVEVFYYNITDTGACCQKPYYCISHKYDDHPEIDSYEKMKEWLCK